ncbi:MAG: hypothetical protein AAGA29_03685 [Planctomycetota bacterium]
MAKSQPHTFLAAVLVVCVLLVPIGVGAGIVYYVLNKPEVEVRRVVVEAIAPTQVDEGDIFELTVVVQNHTDQAVNLNGLDLAVGYFEGFVLFGTTPDYLTESEGRMFRAFEYNVPIAAGGNAQIVFRMQAINAGDWSGDIDARISGSTGTLTTHAHTVVTVPQRFPGSPIDDGPPLLIEPNPE